jgi:hypothetical protein
VCTSNSELLIVALYVLVSNPFGGVWKAFVVQKESTGKGLRSRYGVRKSGMRAHRVFHVLGDHARSMPSMSKNLI